MEEEKIRPIISRVFVTTLLSLGTAVLIHNFYLNRELQIVRNPPLEIPQGTYFRQIEGYTNDGRIKVLTKTDLDHALIIVFSPVCPVCSKNEDRWLKLAEEVRQKGAGWHVFWISRDAFEMTQSYSLQRNIPQDEVLADPPYRTYLQLRMQAVPHTLVVEGGTVKKEWLGALQTAQWDELSASLGLAKPNVASHN